MRAGPPKAPFSGRRPSGMAKNFPAAILWIGAVIHHRFVGFRTPIIPGVPAEIRAF